MRLLFVEICNRDHFAFRDRGTLQRRYRLWSTAMLSVW